MEDESVFVFRVDTTKKYEYSCCFVRQTSFLCRCFPECFSTPPTNPRILSSEILKVFAKSFEIAKAMRKKLPILGCVSIYTFLLGTINNSCYSPTSPRADDHFLGWILVSMSCSMKIRRVFSSFVTKEGELSAALSLFTTAGERRG